MTAPLWLRALATRDPRWRSALARYQHPSRRYPRPSVGEVYAGTWRVVADLGAGFRGRADCAYALRCEVCGRVRPSVYEFNVRAATACRHVGTPHQFYARVVGACPESGAQTIGRDR
ncbi:MAG TPA: hypothetical protein VIY73_21385 [Polyangiaceae bacterium]